MICLGLGCSVNVCGPLDKKATPQRLLSLTLATLSSTAAHLGQLENIWAARNPDFFLLATGSTLTPLAHHNRRADIAHIFVYSGLFLYEHKASLCVSVSVCVYICAPLYECICMSTYAHLCVYVCMGTYICAPLCVYMSVCLHMRAPVSVSLCV